jgi:protein-disulfide isomerase
MNTYDQKQGRVAGKKAAPIIAIIIGVLLIVLGRTIQSQTGVVKLPGDVAQAVVEGLKPISVADHTRGDVAASMKLIEYSDLQCPFCKIFHQSMLEIAPEYIDTGKLQWAYRHFPLTSIHENAKDMAIASECGFKLGGNDAFWKIVDGIFADTAQKFEMSKLPAIAKAAGVNAAQYATCFARKQTVAVVDADMADGAKIGIMGTPYAVIISPKGDTFPLARAYSADELRQILDAVATR